MADTETSDGVPTGDEAAAPKSKFKLIAIVAGVLVLAADPVNRTALPSRGSLR